IDWSWKLLDPWEQSALAQSSVFRGGFTLEAAEAVIDLSEVRPPGGGAAPWILDVLQGLRDKSLLFAYATPSAPVGAESRFTTYVSIRAYAAEKLLELEMEAGAMERHADYFMRVGRAASERLDSADGVDAQRLLGVEGENLTAVFRRAVDSRAATGS